jgi:hypothetical protein
MLGILVLVSLALFAIGLFNPKISIFWDKGLATIKNSIIIYGGILILLIVILSQIVEQKTPTNLELTTKKIESFEEPNRLIKILSNNGIGELKEWSNPYDTGWGSLSDYYQFGTPKNENGMKNNICYYLEGTEHEVTTLTVNLNINNPSEKKEALKFLSEITQKTFSSLDMDIPDDLSKAIKGSKKYELQIKNLVVSYVLEKNKIETWKVIIEKR